MTTKKDFEITKKDLYILGGIYFISRILSMGMSNLGTKSPSRVI